MSSEESSSATWSSTPIFQETSKASYEFGDGREDYEADASESNDVVEYSVVPEGEDEADEGSNSNASPVRDDPVVDVSRDDAGVKPELLSDLDDFYNELDADLFAMGIGAEWRKAQLKLPRRKKPAGYVKGETLSTEGSIGELRRKLCVPEEVKILLPSRSDRADNPPPGYVTLYETYFLRCLLWFPVPALLVKFISAVNLSISQVVPRGIRHIVGILV